LAWVALSYVLPSLPAPIRFFAAWLVFTIGPGLALGERLTRDLDPLRRAIICLGLGTGVLPLLVELVGRTGLMPTFPYVVCALAGIALSAGKWTGDVLSARRADLAACAGIAVLAVALGAIVFAHRLIETPEGLHVYGDYDSYDLSHYAAWASDATHTIPPRASFYSGHGLHAAYYPQLVLAMANRFAGVPLLNMYFQYAWPTFLVLGGLSAFALVRHLAATGTAFLAAVLLLVGSDFSYLAAWLLPSKTFQWDYVLWPTNFLAPTMEVLHFNTWGPTLPVFFTALYAVARALERRDAGWTVAGALLVAVLFQFKPFAYVVLVAGMGAAFVFAGKDWEFRRRMFAVALLTGVFTVPLVYEILTLPAADRRSQLVVDWFVLPQRMLIKLDLTDAFQQFAVRTAPVRFLQQPLFLAAATVLFLLAGPGLRWLGAKWIWRALTSRDATGSPAWRLLAWIAVAGVAIPFVLATEPYVDTLQFYQTGLFVWWIFTAAALAAFARSHRATGAAAIALTLLLSTPSSLHYLARKWTDDSRPAIAELSRNEVAVADYLRTQDPEATIVLHDQPRSPSLVAVIANRRVVLGWGRGYYAVGSEQRVRDIDRFFGSARHTSEDALATLKRYGVTHVIVHPDRNRVHRDVIARLTPVMTFADVVLYRTAPQ
jgi:hypothetical protein